VARTVPTDALFAPSVSARQWVHCWALHFGVTTHEMYFAYSPTVGDVLWLCNRSSATSQSPHDCKHYHSTLILSTPRFLAEKHNTFFNTPGNTFL